MPGRRTSLAIVMVTLFLTSVRMVWAGIPMTASCPELPSADDSWNSGQSYESHEMLMKLVDGPKLVTMDRVGVLQRLALQAWLQSGWADSAMSVSKRAIVECQKISDSLEGVVSYAKAVFEHEKDAYLAGKSRDLPALRDVLQRLNAIGRQAPSEAYLWELSLGVSLLLNDDRSAMISLRQYREMEPDDLLDRSEGGRFKLFPRCSASGTVMIWIASPAEPLLRGWQL